MGSYGFPVYALVVKKDEPRKTLLVPICEAAWLESWGHFVIREFEPVPIVSGEPQSNPRRRYYKESE